MELINLFVDLIVHLDRHLFTLTAEYGIWTYAILAVIIFSETGLVVTPFLPGDSLLFAAGAVSASMGTLNIWILILLLSLAALIGNITNYRIGYHLGPPVFNRKDSRIFKQEYLVITQRYFTRYGGKTIIIGRFLPIIRTFAPFVAGAGKMDPRKFAKFSAAGAVLWVGLFAAGGYLFGNIPAVKRHFSAMVIAIIFISVLPAVFEFARHQYFKTGLPPGGSH